MIDCPLEQLSDDLPAGQAGRWWCPFCDPDKKRFLPVKARRNCRSSAAPLGVAAQSTRRLARPYRGCTKRHKGRKLSSRLFSYRRT